ncbi:phage terminase large subunit family protein [Methylopila musalis]|uniref:Phage terminase large subunit family protein n=1 Tax=Methylopila musalis TaxID=1134781 RepID=A0ABW3Z382_9HYPH
MPDHAFDVSFAAELSDVGFLYRAAAAAIRPEAPLTVSDWALRHRRLSAEASSQPGPWTHDAMPYLVEIMDALGPEDPCHTVTLIKPAQSGGSAAGENWLGHMMCREPGPAMYVQATIKAAKDWKTEKFDPMIRDSDALAPAKGGVVAPQKSRDGKGTTSDRIVFNGGFILLAGANSAATLRQHSIRYVLKDDIDAWDDMAGRESDPDKMADARVKSYRRFGLSKAFEVSSPVEKQRSRIARKYAAGDRRRWHMGCTACGALTDFEWEDVVREPVAPFRCRLVCPTCGAEHRQGDREAMNALGLWISTAPDADGVVPPKTIASDEIEAWRGRFPNGRNGRKSYAITGVMNYLETWDHLAEKDVDAGTDPVARKAFECDDLGRDYDAKDAVVAWEILSARREGDWTLRRAPVGPLAFTLGVDVQGYGVYVESLGWGPNRENWLIDAQLLPGETDASGEGAWARLADYVERGVRLASGARVQFDLVGVDSGYNAEAVYDFTRKRVNCIAVKGKDGWSRPAIYRAESADILKGGLSAGKASKAGVKVWLIGGWSLKSAIMVYLSRGLEAAEPGQSAPRGYCHFPADTSEDYFRQLTSESVQLEKDSSGEPRRVWVKHGANHYLDCRTYNAALSHFLNLWNWPEERWAERAAQIAALSAPAQTSLFGDDAAGGREVVVVPEPVDGAPDAPVAEAPDATPPARLRASPFAGLDRLAQLNR